MKSVIIGAGTYGEVYLAYLLEAGIDIIGFLDDDSKYTSAEVKGIPVIGGISSLSTLKERYGVEAVYCPLGNNQLRVKFLKQAQDLGYFTPSYIHPSVEISPDVHIGQGVYILLGTTVMPYTIIKDFVMISMHVSLAHHNILEEGCFLSTGCNFGASIHAKKYAYCGIGSTIMTGIHELGKNCLVGAGAVVTKDVPDNAVVAGIPAKIIKFNEGGGKKHIAIYGAGGFGREVLELINDINAQFHQYNFIGFFDDGIEKGKLIDNYPVLGGIEELNCWGDELALAIAIGSPKTKKSIVENIRNPNVDYPVLIHSNVIIGNEKVEIGKGCVICAGNMITTNVQVGDFTILNLGCTVGHDTKIGKYSSFMPSVNISGEVSIGEAVYVGTGTKIINQLEIGKETIVGAGAVVTKSLPEKCTAVGVPAKVVKVRE